MDTVSKAITMAIKDRIRVRDSIHPLSPDVRIDGKVCLVTGANSGLGKEIAIDLAKRGGKLLLACRSGIPDAGRDIKRLSGSDDVEMFRVDLSDLTSVHAFCDVLHASGYKLDIVVLNAGLAPAKSIKTAQGYEAMFVVHFLANRVMVDRWLTDDVLQPAVNNEEPPRIVLVSSQAHQWAKAIDFTTFENFIEYSVRDTLKYYGSTKLLMCTFAQELSRRLNPGDELRVAVHSLCPGPFISNLGRDAPSYLKIVLVPLMKVLFQSTTKAARPVIHLCCSEEAGKCSGKYLHMMREKTVSPLASDETNGRNLWEASEKLLQTNLP